MLAALVASIHKTEPPGDQVLEVLAACCLPQLLGQTAAVEKENQDQVKSSQYADRLFICINTKINCCPCRSIGNSFSQVQLKENGLYSQLY